MNRKGVILSGGTGSRLFPCTTVVSKQLLPVYDKPMIYYSITNMILAGIRDIAIITNSDFINQYKKLLGDGKQWGINFTYISQEVPTGITDAYILAEDFLDKQDSLLMLGDNILVGDKLELFLKKCTSSMNNTVFGVRVRDPENYGVALLKDKDLVDLQEKPQKPTSNWAVPGFYFLDGNAPKNAKKIMPSARGEKEITDLLKIYVHECNLKIELLGRGYTWFDLGGSDRLLRSANYIELLQTSQNLLIGSPDEASIHAGYIDYIQLSTLQMKVAKSKYGELLKLTMRNFEN